MKNTYNILSIDGGGIRGLYAAAVIHQIERNLGPIHTGFDMVCGTSTGGLIALGLITGMSAKDLRKFYFDRGAKIFPRKTQFARLLGHIKQLLGNGYSSETLKKEIEEVFGTEAVMADALIEGLIPSYNISKGQPIVFKSPHEAADYCRDGSIPIVDIAMATASAPTYFRNHTIDHDNLPNTNCTDGGVWCNNPALAGLLEARTHFVGEGKAYDHVNIISVSTAPKPSGRQFKGGGLLNWKGDIVGAAITGQSHFTHRFLTNLHETPSSDVTYHRINPENLSIEQQKLLEMDLASTPALEQLERLGTHDGQHFVAQHRGILTSIYQSSITT
ncbi:CBASS cGAMP-activated phospholipase [Lewinella sp. 4G2]|uniref:CBASS cGAMP-activated phospholipase n=1 Tax=Lewinella sp. 4G2 TaxID=1803372 RepID=UPI0007B4CB6C|nr:CBASS cGAMP-activated phospholipase [Lewinella sp. 4G2]OAV43964.1 hypothetical protein A3850_005410 [Lewinella sp. 4G2]